MTRKERSRLEVEDLLRELASAEGAAPIVAQLFAPILRRLPVVAVDPAQAMRDALAWAIDWGLTDAEMTEIRDMVIGTGTKAREKNFRPVDLQRAMEGVRKRRPRRGVLVSQKTTPQQYAAWLRYADGDAADGEARKLVRDLYRHGAWTMPSEWPPDGGCGGIRQIEDVAP